MEAVIAILILLVTLVIGIPVPFAFGASAIYTVFSLGYQSDFLMTTGFNATSSIVLLAIPLFILGGAVMERGKIGSALIGVFEKFVGHIRGGLGAAAVITSAIFGAISGSAAATLSCIGSIMMPKLNESKYPLHISASLIACACPLGLLIPPSAAQILYAWSSGQSVLACFLSTIIPGIILVILLCTTNYFLVRKYPIKVLPKETPAVWGKDLLKKTKHAFPALLMPIIILGGIYGGFLTPTEAAAVSVVYAIPIGMFVYKGLTLRGLKDALVKSCTTTGVVMVMIFTISMLSRMFTLENLPARMVTTLLSISDNKIVLLLMVNVFMVIIGMLMDDSSGILLCTPILLPLMIEIGVNPIHFAAILGVNLGMGNITPPCAPMLYLAARVANAEVRTMMKPTMVFILCAYLPTLLLTTYIPELSLFLPKLVMPHLF